MTPVMTLPVSVAAATAVKPVAASARRRSSASRSRSLLSTTAARATKDASRQGGFVPGFHGLGLVPRATMTKGFPPSSQKVEAPYRA